MGQPAARLTDMHLCPQFSGEVPHVGGPIEEGEPTVYIGGLMAARVTDMAYCNGPPDEIAEGSPTVYIGGLMAARLGDATAHGGVVIEGEPTVLIGDGSGGSDSDGEDDACEDGDGEDGEDDDDADALFGFDKDKYIPDKDKNLFNADLEVAKTWLDGSYTAKTYGNDDHSLKLLSADASLTSSLEFDPRKNEYKATAIDATVDVTLAKAEAKQSFGTPLDGQGTASESVEAGELEASANASASYKDGTLKGELSAGANATLVQATEQGSITIPVGKIYENTIGRIVSLPVPTWLGSAAIVIGGQVQAGIGASASASATAEIGKEGAKFSAGTKLGAGPMAGINLNLGIVWGPSDPADGT